MRRYPLADLLAATGLTESGLTRRAGLSGSTLVRARESGLTADAADRYAVRCGLHPSTVWVGWGEEEATVICPGCEERFIPLRRSHHWCTKQCYQRSYKKVAYRARYASDPEFRARELERSRRQREEAPRVRKIKKAAYYEANKPRILAKKAEHYRANRERILAAEAERRRRRQEQAA